jgi:glyoxylase-like metal-dependent hydrolase (beta-lactamase superfamily II)
VRQQRDIGRRDLGSDGEKTGRRFQEAPVSAQDAVYGRGAPDGLHRLRTLIANVYFVEGQGGWVLVDGGLRGTATMIRRAAERLFGRDTSPTAIVLTHGHFDHVGALDALARRWRVPIYVHPLEIPFVSGRSAYPPPDPTVGGGLVSLLSPLFPRGPYDFGSRVRMLPEDGTVPHLPEWRWIHTPGHSPGHVSLFRDADRTLVSGDAVVSTRQESLTDVLLQIERVWRPPAYYTVDWQAAGGSVRTLAALAPEYLATGHGRILHGELMRNALNRLARHFADLRPRRGRYVEQPAITDSRGVVAIPPPKRVAVSWRTAGALTLVAGGIWLARANRR